MPTNQSNSPGFATRVENLEYTVDVDGSAGIGLDFSKKLILEAHAEASGKYGKGSAANFGHVKLVDDVVDGAGGNLSGLGAANGVAASGSALQKARSELEKLLKQLKADSSNETSNLQAQIEAIKTTIKNLDVDGYATDKELKTAIDNLNNSLTSLINGKSYAVPGMVVAFSGSFSGRNPIPLGATAADTSWVLCDGGDNGRGGKVPDLRGKFILGSSSSNAPGSTGGASSHTHSMTGNVGNTTLTIDQIPAHTHSVGVGNNDGAWPYANGCSDLNGWSNIGGTTGGGKPHTHSLSNVTSTAASSLPPYYALAYIIKIK